MNGQVPPLRVITMVALTIIAVIFIAAIFAVLFPGVPNLKPNPWGVAKVLGTVAVIVWLLIAGWRHTLSDRRDSQQSPVNPPAPNPDAPAGADGPRASEATPPS